MLSNSLNNHAKMPKLCGFCQDIDFAQVENEDGYKHHTNINELISCTENRACDFCVLIADVKKSVEGGKDGNKTFASLFAEPTVSHIDGKPEHVKSPSGRVIISINNVGNNAGTERLCIVEEDSTLKSQISSEITDGLKDTLKASKALQNAKHDGVQLFSPIYCEEGMFQLTLINADAGLTQLKVLSKPK